MTSGEGTSAGGPNEGSTGSTEPASTGSEPTTTGTSESSSTGDDAPGGECGDGVLDPDEECDDGPANDNSAKCTGSCTVNVCGDGYKEEGKEECDLGPANANLPCSGCSTGCELGPHCGDGELQAECGELCDGPMNDSGLECSATCGFEGGKLVFVTADTFTGDLTAHTERVVESGIEAADWICHDLADAQGLVPLPGEGMEHEEPVFRAWLSTPDDPVSGRLSGAEATYLMRNGVSLAESWAGFKSADLLNTITATEINGVNVGEVEVWTNTRATGGSASDDGHCFGWSSNQGQGRIGLTSYSESELWTYIPRGQGAIACWWSRHLYCIEQ